jgi:hypothetical protein
MQMHILSDSQHKELTQTLSKLQSILGGSVSVSLDSKSAGAPAPKADTEAKPKAVRRTRRGRRGSLNETKVLEIKRQLAAGDRPASQIAAQFGVHVTTIYGIKYGNTWKNVQLQQDHAPASIDA